MANTTSTPNEGPKKPMQKNADFKTPADKKMNQAPLEAQGTKEEKTEFNRNDFSEREYKENSFGEFSDDEASEEVESDRQPPSDII